MSYETAGEILLYMLITLFAIAFVVAIFLCVRLWVGEDRSWNLSKLVAILIPIPLLVRDVDMSLHTDSNYLAQPIADQEPLSIFLGGLPNYIFFSVYILLALFCVIYHQAFDRKANFAAKMKWIYMGINIVVYAIWSALLILMFTISEHERSILHQIEAVYSASLCLLAMIAFVFYGYRIYSKLSNNPLRSPSRLEISRKVGFLTLFLGIVFGCRFVVIILDIFAFTGGSLANIISKVGYQLAFELIPALVILWVIARKNYSTETQSVDETSPFNSEEGSTILTASDNEAATRYVVTP